MCILNHRTKLHGLYYFTIIVCDHILYWRKNEKKKGLCHYLYFRFTKGLIVHNKNEMFFSSSPQF